ncbi:unnamed protein product [Protopolystoma xenopodis]|uniref:Uncharacterized protein n=1 Tax=Protopolystoma xenopodis TaxID=117903 RepID=A0A448XNN4_9PLAT|nr:unnamed protein product [Protopolystoma xenopodis]
MGCRFSCGSYFDNGSLKVKLPPKTGRGGMQQMAQMSVGRALHKPFEGHKKGGIASLKSTCTLSDGMGISTAYSVRGHNGEVETTDRSIYRSAIRKDHTEEYGCNQNNAERQSHKEWLRCRVRPRGSRLKPAPSDKHHWWTHKQKTRTQDTLYRPLFSTSHVHSFVHSFIHTFIHSTTRSLVRWFILQGTLWDKQTNIQNAFVRHKVTNITPSGFHAVAATWPKPQLGDDFSG